jgi:hypothetical protein
MLFDSSDEETEEVSLRTPEEGGSGEDSSDLHSEVETRLGSETSSTSTSSRSSSSSSVSSEVSLDDIKKQNERIISLLEDIKNGNSSENNNEDNSVAGGDPTELL